MPRDDTGIAKHQQRPDPDPSPEGEGRPSGLIMLVVMLVLVGGGYFLAVKLREQGRLQDCLMQGRTNCTPIVTPDR